MASTMGTALGSTQGSCLPLALRVVDSPSRVTVFCSWLMVAVGLKAIPGSVHVFAAALAKGDMHPLAKPFSMFRFHTGALVDEHGAAGVAH